MGLENGDLVRVESFGRRLEAPVWIMPGQAPETVALALGYGRERAGAVGSGVGVNAYRLRTTQAPWQAPCSLTPLGAQARLVSTELHQRLDEPAAARRVTPGERASSLDESATPAFHRQTSNEGAHQWGMAIDLDLCIGCGACTIACQAENNIPVVGPDEVAEAREMHWLRIDRYFRGSAEDPGIDFQPVPCMHCETAPCEPVCPVAATTHSSEGINQMTYNRCIGTRSCSNNCPYKVRRFNWFDYQDAPLSRPPESANPNVYVRSGGVMEKCTYCVQRIEAFHAEEDGTLPRTACQEACPTQAIVFGDITETGSAVAEAKRSLRSYALLEGHNLAPRTTYLARIDDSGGSERG